MANLQSLPFHALGVATILVSASCVTLARSASIAPVPQASKHHPASLWAPSSTPELDDLGMSYRPGKKLKIGFASEGDLSIANYGDVVPMAFCLVQTRPSGVYRIRKPGDLAGHVHLATAHDALQYVRMWTYPEIGCTVKVSPQLPAWVFEIVPRKSFVSAMFGDRDDYSNFDGGVVDDAWFKKSGLAPANVLKLGNSWLVIRPAIARQLNRTYIPVLLKETVGADGSYSATSTPLAVRTVPPGGWRDLPMRE